MKTIIAGGRDFNNYELLKNECDKYFITEVVSGTARGADSLGELYAKNNSIPIKQFPADWDKYQKRAGYIRNSEMADYGERLIAFWNGSKGTGHMIDLANKKGLEVIIIKY